MRVFVSQSLLCLKNLTKPSIPLRPRTLHDENYAKLCKEHASSCGDNNDDSQTSINSNRNNDRMTNTMQNLHCEMHDDSNDEISRNVNQQLNVHSTIVTDAFKSLHSSQPNAASMTCLTPCPQPIIEHAGLSMLQDTQHVDDVLVDREEALNTHTSQTTK